MKQAKIQFKLGCVDFSGEGDPQWVAHQLDKVLARAAELIESHALTFGHVEEPASNDDQSIQSISETIHNDRNAETAGEHRICNIGLDQYIREMHASDSQVRRFLATAQWLHVRGNRRPSTRDVSRALQDHGQKKLSNPAACLSRNVKKGLCRKDDKHFYVTAAGRAALRVA